MKSKIVIDTASVGLGVIAKVPIEPRETIFFVTGPIVTFEECIRLPDGGANTFQIGLDAYVDPGYPGRYINHSCEPNAGLVDETCMIALRQINPGEEIRYDYSTALLERYWVLDCRCGSPRCRGTVGDFDTLPERVQQHYLRLGVVQPFIIEALAAPAVERAQLVRTR